MEIKKSEKADLEKHKGTSLLIGYIVALALLFACFEYTTRDYVENEPVIYAASAVSEEEVIPITQPIFQAAPSPPANAPQVFEVLNVVDNNKEIAEEEEIESTEASTEAISGPSGPVVTGPVVTGPVTAVEEETDEGQIFQVVEQMPEFPGGMEALMKYLQKNIKYPSRAQDNNVQGRVMVTFVVNKDGTIVDPEVIKAVDKDLDNEALRVVKGMPKWNPGKQRGKPVRVKYTVPVTFRLQ